MRLLSLPSTAKKINCGTYTVRSMARNGQLPTVLVGKRLKVEEGELRRWLANGGAKSMILGDMR
jgi:hypothetical protein